MYEREMMILSLKVFLGPMKKILSVWKFYQSPWENQKRDLLFKFHEIYIQC